MIIKMFFKQDINFLLKKSYYKYIKHDTKNLYRLLILTEQYKKIGIHYYNKYGTNYFDDKLLKTNESKIDYLNASKLQQEIRKEFFENLEILSNKPENSNCKVCSKWFKDFYVDKQYHYGQCIDNVIIDIKKDILNQEKINS